MERILFGDNQFFGVNHISDEKARAQSIKFKDDSTIIKTLDEAQSFGINTFMCTTYERIGNICEVIRKDEKSIRTFKICPCMPYAHKYANTVTELGIIGTVNKYVPGNIFGSLFKGGVAFISKDFVSIMKLLIDAEMKMFKGVNTPVIFLQNVIADLLLGLRAYDIFTAFDQYVKRKYNAEAGFITMNMPKMVDALQKCGIVNPIICFSVNKVGFRMSGGKQVYEEALQTKKIRGIAMQVLCGGAIPASDALEYVCNLPNIESILFGASSKANIQNTVENIHRFDSLKSLSL